ncbi:Predicted PurR-regulated permease PerM [Natronorubrum sediminis]|uniref:Predicted PurR-regulated permease PerM n=1 Tax=Natronorubrum sediminis TaxID=640943 RepID=A0A1H6FY28_9EURY|nr:AI-2E family transporter [Natronorubrum sediminis]SEH15721.1 Predicted PurR-regulated permease PerM [Natronorubrum sediminis]
MDVRTAFFALLLVVLGAIATLMIAPLLQYVLAAALLAFVLHPAYERLAERMGPRPAALSLTIFAIVAAVVPLLIISIIVLDTVLSFLDGFDEEQAIESVFAFLVDDLGVEDGQLEAIETAVLTEVEASLSQAVEFVLLEVIGLLNASIEMGLGLIVFVFLLYYLLVDGDRLVAWLSDVAPIDPSVREELFDEVSTVTWAVIYSHVLVALVEGVLGGLGLYLLGVPNVAFWTVIMIVVAFLPAVGVWLVWAPAVGYLAMTSGPLPAVLLLLYGITVLSLVDNYLRAVFVDRGSGLHPAVVIVGVIGGIYLLGIMGLFLGPVLLAVFKAGLNVFNRLSLEGEARASSTDSEPSAPPKPQAGVERGVADSDGAD